MALFPEAVLEVTRKDHDAIAMRWRQVHQDQIEQLPSVDCKRVRKVDGRVAVLPDSPGVDRVAVQRSKRPTAMIAMGL
ncbi:hypothetical protein Acor_67880 [Acrocarpospora corrugata]|uniref:Uncharacterized protein n=1 Tax=Acrocarpospora corrugata TaxID=35763 RepID=A0A5M3W913_9ACTN|nr:hypothetical protein Acor_67880 [Acrocarpospora corrugata]